MLAEVDREQLLKEELEVLKNEDPGRDASIGYLFENAYTYSDIIKKYEDLLIQWSPELSLLYIIENKQIHGIK